MGKTVSKNKKVNHNGVFYVVIPLALIVSFGLVASGALADVSLKQLLANALADKIAPDILAQLQTIDEPALGAVVEDKNADIEVNLDFSAGATTTPGGLFAITNGRQAKICTDVVLDISKADTAGGPDGAGARLGYRVATSSSATNWRAGDVTLIASSTLASSTTGLISNVVNTGTYTTNDADAGAPWVFGAGVSLLGAFDITNIEGGIGDEIASSTAYTATVGKVYVKCQNR